MNKDNDKNKMNADEAPMNPENGNAARSPKADSNNTGDANEDIIKSATTGDYKYGFVTDIDTHVIPKGLNEDVVRYISQVKGEPEWLLDFRLKAYRHWLTMKMPRWAHLDIPEIDYQAISYYAAPKQKEGPKNLDEVDPECARHSTNSASRSKSKCD